MGNPGVNTAILFDPASGDWKRYEKPCEVITASRPAEVLPALAHVEAEVNSRGLHAAGFLSYDAAEAFDSALPPSPDDPFPLLWFGLYRGYRRESLPHNASPLELEWLPEISEHQFEQSLALIKQAIARGETYQVNFTFPLRSRFEGDPWDFFLQLAPGQSAREAAYIDTGRHVICSASPELFFDLKGEHLVSRPMKGTASRGMTLAEDQRQQERLKSSEKDRAENVMILDMIRNDLGRLPGGPVRTLDEFALEKYPSVWQMTSSAATETAAAVVDIFRALFPCASITGAPKVRTMHLIRQLEARPRRIYTGAIGHISPQRSSRFSVAIRTALIDREEKTAEYGVGAGITWGSNPQDEFRECLLKARILSTPQQEFELLETLLWTKDDGYALLEGHLQRMRDSAEYFGFPCSPEVLRETLADLTRETDCTALKVRLLLDRQGAVRIEATPLESPGSCPPLRVALAAAPVDPGDPFLYHKTTRREIYDRARAAHPDVDEVLLWNTRGELTEACNYNLVVERNGELLTPPISSGLLAGTLRSQLLREGKLREVVVRREELRTCDRLWLINSVRGWREALLKTDSVGLEAE